VRELAGVLRSPHQNAVGDLSQALVPLEVPAPRGRARKPQACESHAATATLLLLWHWGGANSRLAPNTAGPCAAAAAPTPLPPPLLPPPLRSSPAALLRPAAAPTHDAAGGVRGGRRRAPQPQLPGRQEGGARRRRGRRRARATCACRGARPATGRGEQRPQQERARDDNDGARGHLQRTSIRRHQYFVSQRRGLQKV